MCVCVCVWWYSFPRRLETLWGHILLLRYHSLEVTYAQGSSTVYFKNTHTHTHTHTRNPPNNRPSGWHPAFRLDLHWFLKRSNTDTSPATHIQTCTHTHTHTHTQADTHFLPSPMPHPDTPISSDYQMVTFLDRVIVLMISAINPLSHSSPHM